MGRAAPEWSNKKRELLVCTAGITKNLEWRRLYPIFIEDIENIHGFSWVDVKVTREGLQDARPESRKVVREYGPYLTEVGNVKDEGVRKWYAENLVKDCVEVMKPLRQTIGIVKPIIESFELMEVEPTSKTDEEQTTLSAWASFSNEKETEEKWKINYAKKDFEVRCKFKCGSSCQLKHHDMKVLDIEFFMLYRHVFKKYQDMNITFQKMKEKLEKELEAKDFYFVLGSHSRYPFHSYMIGSVLRFKKDLQMMAPSEVT